VPPMVVLLSLIGSGTVTEHRMVIGRGHRMEYLREFQMEYQREFQTEYQREFQMEYRTTGSLAIHWGVLLLLQEVSVQVLVV
jgi:hypothetical protein